jgi:transcriptional regulator with PAS, ATPase and Fis domain
MNAAAQQKETAVANVASVTIAEGLASLVESLAGHQAAIARITLKRPRQTYEHDVPNISLTEDATLIEGRFENATVTIYCVSTMDAGTIAELQAAASSAANESLNWIAEATVAEPTNHLTLVKAPAETKGRMIGNSASMKELAGDIRRAARSPHVVLITGESGTGKTTAAKMIHEQGPRKAKAFIAVNCAAIPDNLIESELFGYEKGAFTGAAGSKEGLFELAQEGTLFLDEIGELKLELQAKLLTAIEQQIIRRLGGTKDIKCNVRIIAASSRNLLEMVAAGKFRDDLYYRLAVLEVPIAPLRDRHQDIPLLVRDRLVYEQHLADLSAPIKIEPAAMQELTHYTWPGNIRQLHNVISRLATRAEDCGTPITAAATHKEIARFTQSTNRVLLQDGSIMLPAECRKLLPDESLMEYAARVKRILIETVRNEKGSMQAASRRLRFERSALVKLLARIVGAENADKDEEDEAAAA